MSVAAALLDSLVSNPFVDETLIDSATSAVADEPASVFRDRTHLPDFIGR